MPKIELEEPYKSKWKYGYLVTNKENRKTVILFNNKNDRTSTQYARYLMSVSVGRFLDKDLETVDHIDGDKTNDAIENLTILSRKENIVKSAKKDDFICICPICFKEFIVPRSRSGKKIREKIKNNEVCCSVACGRVSASNKLKKNNI